MWPSVSTMIIIFCVVCLIVCWVCSVWRDPSNTAPLLTAARQWWRGQSLPDLNTLQCALDASYAEDRVLVERERELRRLVAAEAEHEPPRVAPPHPDPPITQAMARNPTTSPDLTASSAEQRVSRQRRAMQRDATRTAREARQQREREIAALRESLDKDKRDLQSRQQELYRQLAHARRGRQDEEDTRERRARERDRDVRDFWLAVGAGLAMINRN